MEENIKGIIYMIKCNITGEVYYGSTCSTLETRMSKHRAPSNKCISKQIIDRGDYTYEIVLECRVPNKTELLKIENMYIKTNPCINSRAAYRSEEDIKQYHQNYRIENASTININNQNYYYTLPTIYCECGGSYVSRGKNRHEKTNKHREWLKTQENDDDDYDDFDEIEQ